VTRQSFGDVCPPDPENDADGDGLCESADNCPIIANGNQSDLADDGVLDTVDACVPSPVGEAVNAAGCTIVEPCPREHPVEGDKWKNHGAYVSCVAHATNDFVAAGLMTETERGEIVSAAGESTCGHKNK
jgi:hypothetical protein